MKKCYNCGYESQDGNFCPGCGGNLVDVEQIQQSQEEQSVVEQPVYDYQQPVQQMYQPMPAVADEEVSLGNWMVTILLTAIPCVNLIMLLVWAFGGGAPKSKSNWAKANLIYVLISLAISLITGIIIGIAGASLVGGMYY